MIIQSIHARQILDSRGNPTIEADVTLENGIMGRAAVPSGASTGTYEAIELRDNDTSKYGGKGVLNAVGNVNSEIAKVFTGFDVTQQKALDEKLIALDGTKNKSRLGANAMLAVSLAAARAAAQVKQLPLFEYLRRMTQIQSAPLLPMPMFNIINGGKHAANATDIQEFMIIPISATTFSDALRMGAEIFHALGKVLSENGYGTTVGDEGGYAPQVQEGNKKALDLMTKAIEKAGYHVGEDVMFALDIAASELYTNGMYSLHTEKKTISSDEMVKWLYELTNTYPIVSIEDGLAENDWEGWKKLTQAVGEKIQLVGDDLFVTNTTFLQKGITEQAGNAILIKLNQIGTLTETVAAVKMANDANFRSIISHRSGETEDVFIAHLAVALATGQIKTGSLSRTDRIAKYNELLRIEEMLGSAARFASLKIQQ